jgi:hypothetical protein
MREAQEAIRRVLTGAPVGGPQPAAARLCAASSTMAVRSANLVSHSHGRDPQRHVRILRE